MRDEGFQFFGFMTIMVVAAVAIYAIQAGLSQPGVIKDIAAISPWAGNHAEQISWVAIGIVSLTAVALPPMLMRRSAAGGENGLANIGVGAWAVCIGLAIMFLIPSIGFLLGVGWLSAKQFVGI